MLEFVHSSDEISEQELEFVTTVAETFNISNEEFNNLRNFTENKKDNVNAHELLIIDNKEQAQGEIKHIFCEHFNDGIELWVVSIPSVGMYALKLIGSQELLLNGQAITPEKIYILTPGSSLRSQKVKPIYYSDIISRFLADKSSAVVSFQAVDWSINSPAVN